MHFAVFVLHSSLILHCLLLKSHRRCRKNCSFTSKFLLLTEVKFVSASFLTSFLPIFPSCLLPAPTLPPGEKLEGRVWQWRARRMGEASHISWFPSSPSDNNDNNWTRAKTRKTDEPPFLRQSFLGRFLPSSAPSPPAGGEPPFHMDNFLPLRN